jgi:hypothetical protein
MSSSAPTLRQIHPPADMSNEERGNRQLLENFSLLVVRRWEVTAVPLVHCQPERSEATPSGVESRCRPRDVGSFDPGAECTALSLGMQNKD